LADLARKDPEWPVRARAVELSAGIAALVPTIIEAVDDPAPRVREAALHTIASSRLGSAGGRVGRALTDDPWTFVRVSAAEALGSIAADPAPLATALEDGNPKVRVAAIGALGKLRATSQAGKIRERLDDTKEDVEVRALAARTLGQLCIQSAADRLTKLAMLARQPVDEADDRIGTAAIDALAHLHPSDIEKRLAPLREKGVRPPVKRAAERAIAEPGTCR
jgi:HEAT repeat protein